MAVHLRLYTEAGAFVCLLPDVADADAQEELNGEGAWSARYPATGYNVDRLLAADAGMVGIVVDGEELYTGLLEDDGDNEADPHDQVVVSGRGTIALLERALVYPLWGVGTSPAAQEFVDASPGNVLGQLITWAQGRGALPGVTWTFTYTHDSNGQPWAHAITVAYDAGVNLLQVAQGLVGQGVVELRMVGTELRAYNPDTVLAANRPDVVLHVGQSTDQLPRQRSRRDLASTVLVLGDEGKTVERHDATTAAKYGRREVAHSTGNSKHTGTMNVIGDTVLRQRKQPAHGRTLSYSRDLAAELAGAPRVPMPWLDYQVGQRIRLGHVVQADGTLEPQRVRSMAAVFTADGVVQPSVELNDVFLEASVRLQRRIEGIVNGTVTTSAAAAAQAAQDTVAPGQVDTVAVTSGAYLRSDGTVGAAATISWPQLVGNEDGTVLSDLDGYLVSWRQAGAARWSGERFTSELSLDVDVPPGATVEARVRARDTNGNKGLYRTSLQHVVAKDAAAPPTPSAPVVTAGFGIVRARWDGLGSAGEAMPNDLAHVEVHASAAGAGFAPTNATLRDQLRAPGTSPLTGDPYNQVLYVRLVAVDRSGNRSAPSAAGQGTPTRGQDADLENVSASKLTAGVMTADVTVSGRFATALSGARVELGAVGLRQYNSAGAETARIDTAGGSLLTGTVTTRATPSSTGVELSGATAKLYYGATLTGELAGAVDAFGYAGLMLAGTKGTGYRRPELSLRADYNGALLQADAIQLYTNRSATVRQQWLAAYSGSMQVGDPNYAADPVYVMTQLEVDRRFTAWERALFRFAGDVSLANDSGIVVIGESNWTQLGIDSNEIQTRQAGSALNLNLNNNGGDTILGSSGGNLTCRNWSSGTGSEIYRSSGSGKLVFNTVGSGNVDTRDGANAYSTHRAAVFAVNSDSRTKRDIRPLAMDRGRAWASLAGGTATFKRQRPKGYWRQRTNRELAELIAAAPKGEDGQVLEQVALQEWVEFGPDRPDPGAAGADRDRHGFLADKLDPSLLAEPDPDHGAMIDIGAVLAALVAKVDELDRRPAGAR